MRAVLFGLIGLFLGPVVITVLLAVWRERQDERTADGVQGGGRGDPAPGPLRR